MRISVVIPCGRPHRLAPLLDRLSAQHTSGFQTEIVVVAPGHPPVAPHGRDFKLVSVEALEPPGRMRNLGASAATGEILAFIDDDCLPPANWLVSLHRELSTAADLGAIGCRLAAWPKSFWNECADTALFWPYLGFVPRDSSLGSAALMVRREAFIASGGFDEGLRASEDWDFCLRLRADGWRCRFDPSVLVVHDHRRGGFIPILRQSFDSGRRSGLIVQKRHPEHMTCIGKLSLACGTPGRYFALIFPLALLNTAVQVLPMVRHRLRTALFAPVVFLARLAYHIGVWRQLSHKAVPVNQKGDRVLS